MMSRLTGGWLFWGKKMRLIFSFQILPSRSSVSLFMYMVIKRLVKKDYGDVDILIRSDVKDTR